MFGRDEKTNISLLCFLNQTSLMKDQVEFLKSMVITAEFIGEGQRDGESQKSCSEFSIARLRWGLQITTQ